MKKFWVDGSHVTTDLFSHTVATRSIADLERFMNPKWPDHLHDPFLLSDMEKAVARIWQAIQEKQAIGVVGDYDMDGTPGAALLAQFLALFNHPVDVILPTRSDGYGFSAAFVDRLCQNKTQLIITVDCGIRDETAVRHAREKYNCDVIITDHHECPESLPPAFAVINPKRSDSHYPFRELCGTGVVFKLVQALIAQAPSEYRPSIPNGWLAWSLDLVVLATIGDMVPLVDENRVLAHYGLRVLQKTPRLGLSRLIQSLELQKEALTYSDISYKIIPKCNASGRLETMDDVFTLLATTDPAEADAAVKRVLVRSTQCQILLTNMMDHARQKLAEITDQPVILLADERWHPGLTGIVAGRLADEYKKPVGIFAEVEAQHYRGSMRSVPGLSLPVLLEQAASVLDKYGGHEQAAGLSFAKQNFDSFQQIMVNSVKDQPSKPSLMTDGTITADAALPSIVEKLNQLAPWGIGNPEPVWSFQNVTLRDVRWLSDGKHLRAVIPGEKEQLTLIFFGVEAVKPFVEAHLDIYGTLAINEFRGNRTPQLMVKGMVPTQP